VRHFKSATEPKSLDVFAILEGHQGLEPFLLAQCSGPDPKKGRLSKPTEAEADQAVPDNLPASPGSHTHLLAPQTEQTATHSGTPTP